MNKILTLIFIFFLGQNVVGQRIMAVPTFWENWSISVMGGMYHSLKYSPNTNVVTPIAGIGLGRQLTPVLGIEVEADFLTKNRNLSMTRHPRTHLHLVCSYNLMNLFRDYKGRPRTFEIDARFGVGWGHTSVNSRTKPDQDYLVSKFGMGFNLHLGKSRAWKLAFRPMFSYDLRSDEEKMHVAYNANRGELQLNVGLVYHFKNRDGEHYISYVQPAPSIPTLERPSEKEKKQAPEKIERQIVQLEQRADHQYITKQQKQEAQQRLREQQEQEAQQRFREQQEQEAQQRLREQQEQEAQQRLREQQEQEAQQRLREQQEQEAQQRLREQQEQEVQRLREQQEQEIQRLREQQEQEAQRLREQQEQEELQRLREQQEKQTQSEWQNMTNPSWNTSQNIEDSLSLIVDFPRPTVVQSSDKIRKRQEIVVLFQENRAIVEEGYSVVLERMAALLNNNPNMRVRLHGVYTSVYKAQSERRIAIQRAKVLKSLLVAYGIDAQRIDRNDVIFQPKGAQTQWGRGVICIIEE
ncbi:hypothetical protein EII14_08565 [Alloprevotella sp. OH1205_COT-284]|uniref:OmpA family protein n=1 Tax=Alloprevotella sp. OH1205_COT-284 TaxID=2491043 RepID=UPI000F5E8233|nr:OmpA family protein [Alloprevotella sp. OH1205_COT-284]RRD75398.1 hypothetical protein EII14_08565 [Alloprevotella sp. OH1205_COT-284]